MEIKLHSNATTTPRTRKYIQNSPKSDNELAQELNVSIDTIRRWRQRKDCYDRSHRPKTIHRRLLPEQTLLLLFLRQRLGLSLDELVEAVHQLITVNVSRASISRCLKQFKLSKQDKPAEYELGHIWLDCIVLPETIQKEAYYLLIFTEKSSGYLSFALIAQHPNNSDIEKLTAFCQHALPYTIKSIECSAQPHICALMQSLNKPIKGYHQNTWLDTMITLADECHFTQLNAFLQGELYNPRLGLGAILLRYEDFLNQQLFRNRLSGSAQQYLVNQHAAKTPI